MVGILNIIIKCYNHNMNIITIEEWEKSISQRHGEFQNPQWDRHTHDPFVIKDMDKSVDRIHLAIKRHEKIVIYSDYDCDGIPGAVILHDLFKKIGYEDFANYIPHRHKEGYGLNIGAIDSLIRQKYTLMITVDLGITNVKEVEYAEEYGINVILTDHHLPLIADNGQVLPPAFAVINTKRNDCEYAEKMLCGCATAWKLAYAFLIKYGDEYNIKAEQAKWWLDMVGISTIADMVPLLGENRVLATYGLNVLNKTKRQGLLKLLSSGKETLGGLDEESVSFTIAPRLNSASRMDDPMIAFNALAKVGAEALDSAYTLEMLNNQRKRDVLSAGDMVNYSDFENDNIVVVGNRSWTPGILGLISQKIADRTCKTVFVWGEGEDESILKGSVRSGKRENRANVVQLMSECKEFLVHYGGHEEAGGFAILTSNLDKFKERLQQLYTPEKHDNNQKQDVIMLDLASVTGSLLERIEKYRPYGVGNPSPIFVVESVMTSRTFGQDNRHLEVSFPGCGNLKAIRWNVDTQMKENIKNARYILGTIKKDKYRGGIQMMITDIK